MQTKAAKRPARRFILMKKQTILPRKRIIATALVLAALLIFSASITAYAINSRAVLISDDDTQITVNTTKTDLYDILRSKDITLANDDYLDDSSFATEGDCVIRIYRAKNVTLIDEGVPKYVTCAGDVARLLEQNDVAMGERDKLNYDLRDKLFDYMEVIISRAFDVMVQDYGQDYSLTLTEGNVSQALELAGVTLEGEDFAEPAGDVSLTPGLTIRVSRVSYREREKTASIDFETESRKDGKLNLGMVKIEQKGEKGEKRSRYLDKYINGERVDSTVLEETVLKEPVKEIKIVGTKVARLQPGLTPISKLKPPSSVNIVNGVPTNYKSVVVGTAKAYHGGRSTATGLKPQPGYIAVDPKQFPYGTKLWVVSNDGKYIYGYAVAADTGGFVKTKGCTIDLYMPNESMCYQWGHRGVTIYVLDEPRMKVPYKGG